MDREAIEFHDSVLSHIDQSSEKVSFSFEPAYVHRSNGDPARDPGTGWLVNVELTIFGSLPLGQLPHLPSNVWNGSLSIDDLHYENVLPLPFESTGNVTLHLELSGGELVQVSGTGAKLSVAGQYEFVEHVPVGRPASRKKTSPYGLHL